MTFGFRSGHSASASAKAVLAVLTTAAAVFRRVRRGTARVVRGDGATVEGVQVEMSAAAAEPVLFPPPAGRKVDHAGESAYLRRVAR